MSNKLTDQYMDNLALHPITSVSWLSLCSTPPNNCRVVDCIRYKATAYIAETALIPCTHCGEQLTTAKPYLNLDLIGLM